jgi:hypothetical protein
VERGHGRADEWGGIRISLPKGGDEDSFSWTAVVVLFVMLLTSGEALTGKTAGRNVDDAVLTAERR